jgi:thiamine biosynthesis protein ThiI
LDRVILIRYGEIHLKGKNRKFFENKLINNIKKKLDGIEYEFLYKRSRYVIQNYSLETENEIIERLQKVFGIHSISVAHCCNSTIDDIAKTARSICKEYGKFRVTVNRADKNFPLNSVELSRHIGGMLLSKFPGISVDLFNPDFVVNIDIREDGGSFVYIDKIACAGGMPVGCGGKGMLMLSGGIDSPVAGYMMAKRGLSIDAIHFHSYPYTSELAKQKVVDLANIISDYTGEINLVCIPFTKIQEEIHRNCDTSYMITLVRRFMMRIAERVAIKRNCGCIVNGESLGQVASQTLESIFVTNSTIESLPVFRPLIGMDKDEIIDISKKIGAFETSILPYEDCCTVFLPDAPVTHPTLKRAEHEESRIPNWDKLIDEAIDNLEIIKII